MTRRLSAILAGVVLLALAAPAAAPAGHKSKSCGIATKGSRDYRVKARAMTCRNARKWARAFLRSRRRAPRFKCVNPPDRDIPFFCFRGAKAYWVVRL